MKTLPFVLTLVALAAFGLSQSPTPKPTHTIGQIRANPVYDQRVVVRGLVVRQTDRNDFLLRDASGQLEVGASRRAPLSLPVGQTVTLEAEVDTGRSGQLELDVLRYWLPDGRMVTVRQDDR